jgi:hypothetical protein
MLTYSLAFIASFGYVGLKSWQQLNVIHRKYCWIVPTSLAMAALEVYVVASMARSGWGWLVFWVGLGSGLGSAIATWIHYRVTHES